MSAVPKLRFPEFETAYAFRYLGDEVAKISSGKTKAESDGKYELYGSTGVIGKTNSPECHGQNILIARVGANAGALNIVEGSYGVTDNTLILSAAETSCLNFIFYFLKSFNLNRLVFGSGQPLVTGGMIKKLKFSRPSLPEQQKIASFLSSVDKKIDLLRQKKDALELYKKGLMQKIFSQEIRFKRDDGSDFPDWEEVALGDVLGYEQPTKYIVSDTDYSDENQTPVLTAGKSFILGFTNETHDIFEDCLPVIIFDDFTTASKYVDFPFKVKSSAIKILKARRSGDNLRLIYELLNQLKYVAENHQRHWISIFATFPIEVPAENEQQKIAAFLTAMDTKIQNTSSQIEQMETFKKGLLQQMFV